MYITTQKSDISSALLTNVCTEERFSKVKKSLVNINKTFRGESITKSKRKSYYERN